MLASVRLGVTLGAAVGVTDAVLAVARGAPSPLYIVAAAGSYAWVLLPVIVPLLLMASRVVPRWAARCPPGERGPLLASALWGAALLGGAIVATAGLRLDDAAPPAAYRVVVLAIPVACTLSVVLGTSVWVLARRHPNAVVPLLAAPPLLAGGVAFGLRHRLADLDLRFFWVLAVFALGFGIALRRLGATRLPPPRWGYTRTAATVTAAAAGTWLMLGDLQVRATAAHYAPVGDLPLRLWAKVVDLDRDGHSILVGEGDCAPFNTGIHPLGAEIAGNGIDEDCHGGDLDPALFARRPTPPLPEAPLPSPPAILFISVDTLRADHLGLYGYARDTTPEIDRHFGDAVIFESARSTSPVTDRAFESFTGGLYPSMFTEALNYQTHIMGDRRVLLAEVLQAAGYATLTINSFHLLDDFALDQGFATVEILGNRRLQDAAQTTRRALSRIRRHYHDDDAPPLLLWVHYYEPHTRYTPPDAHRLWDDGGPFELADPLDLYDAEIHYVDAEIGRLLDLAPGRGLPPDAWVFFFSDHGEEFLDHGGTRHARKLYEEQIRIPMMIRHASLSPRRVAEPVSLIDLMPTTLDVLGLPFGTGLEGRSLAPALRGAALPEHTYFMEQFRHGTANIQRVGAVRGDLKIILNVQEELWELYDLAADPKERRNIYGARAGDPLRTAILDHWSLIRGAARARPEGGAF